MILDSGNSYDYFVLSPDLASEEALSAFVVNWKGADRDSARIVSDHLPVVAGFACDERYRDRPGEAE